MHTQDYVKGTVSKIECFTLEIPFKASDDKGTDYYDVRNFRTCVIKFDFFQKYLIVIHFVQTQQFTFSVLLNYLVIKTNKRRLQIKFQNSRALSKSYKILIK